MRLARDVHTAEDLTQETLLRGWSRRRQLRDSGAARVWLFRIAVNVWRDQLRRSRRLVARATTLDGEAASFGSSPEQQPRAKEELERALAALDALPDRQREVLYLHACEEMSLAEISEALAISTAAAKASLSLARK